MKDNADIYTFKQVWLMANWSISAQLTTIANLPSKEELISKLLWVLNSSAQRFVTVINAVPRDLAVVIKQIGEAKPAAAEEAPPSEVEVASAEEAAPAEVEAAPAEENPATEVEAASAETPATEVEAAPAEESPAAEVEAALAEESPAAEVEALQKKLRRTKLWKSLSRNKVFVRSRFVPTMQIP